MAGAVDAKNVELGEAEPLIEGEAYGHAQVAPFFPGFSRMVSAKLPDDMTERFNIEGADLSQLLKIKLAPNELVTTEPGAMVVMSEGIKPAVDYGSCGQGCKRMCCAGENFFRLKLKNDTAQEQYLGLAPFGPGSIVPIDLRVYTGLFFSRGAFLAAYGDDWRIDLQTVRSPAAVCCGGQGLFLNKLSGTAMAFITGVGTIEQIDLQPGQKYICDQECVLAFEQTVDFNVKSYGCSLVCCCGGFGLFQTTLTGPGLVLIQTLPMSRFAASLGVKAGGGGGGGDNGSGGQ